jgi:acyl-CoA dehydrogenase
VAAADIEAKFIRAVKKGIVERRLDRDAIADAVAAGVITAEEATVLRTADEATDRVIQVDDFSSEELQRIESQREPQHHAAE